VEQSPGKRDSREQTAPALLKILSELEPAEAKMLNRVVQDTDRVSGYLVYPDTLDLTPARFQNLLRLDCCIRRPSSAAAWSP